MAFTTRRVFAARLTIASDNIRSQWVAQCAGFHLTAAPATQRSRNGLILTMEAWERPLAG